jgi:hypothetical protein
MDINEELLRELEEYKREKEQVRQIIGQIGGYNDSKKEKIINITFIIAIGVLFSFDMLRHIFYFELPLPPLVSIELGIFLISVKIIWMMYKQTKVEHFQFWILNSLEFRMTDLQKKIKSIDEKIKKD